MYTENNFSTQKSYTIKTIRTVSGIEDIRSIWEKMQWHPNADIDFYLTILNSRSEIRNPHVVVLYLGGIPKSMMVGRIEERRFEFKIGYKTIFKPRVRLFTVVYGGLFGINSSEISDLFIGEIVGLLGRGEADMALSGYVGKNSYFYHSARTIPGGFFRGYFPDHSQHFEATLPNKCDEFLKKLKSKHRYWIRRMSRLLETDYPGKVRLKIYQEQSQLDQFCSDVESIAEKTYQRGLGAGFILNNENKERMALSASRGWLRGYILYADGQPCAFWIGTYYGGRFHINFTGYDPNFKKYEPGTILFMKMIEDLCKSDIKKIDFGFGDAFYKRRFSDKKWEEVSSIIFSRSFRGIRLNFMDTSTRACSKIARRVLEKITLLEKVKKHWRNNITRKV